ncbi:MAG: ribonuclease Z [Candidatus Micrarchaeia archaeon]
MIKIVMLGSTASVPTKKHVPSCFAVQADKAYLFDACEGVQRQLMKYNVSYSKVKSVFLSHLHADHFLGLFGLVQTLNMSTRAEELLVFGPKGSGKFLETLFSTNELKPNFKVKVKEVSGTEKKPVFETDVFEVRAFQVKHGKNALGYVFKEKDKRRFDKKKAVKAGIKGRLFTEIGKKGVLKIGKKTVKYEEVTFVQMGKKIVYTGDTAFFSGLEKHFENANAVIADSTFLHEHKDLAKEKEHCTAFQIAKTCKKAQVKKLVLTHFSNRYDDRTPLLVEAKKEFKESALSEEGLELEI